MFRGSGGRGVRGDAQRDETNDGRAMVDGRAMTGHLPASWTCLVNGWQWWRMVNTGYPQTTGVPGWVISYNSWFFWNFLPVEILKLDLQAWYQWQTAVWMNISWWGHVPTDGSARKESWSPHWTLDSFGWLNVLWINRRPQQDADLSAKKCNEQIDWSKQIDTNSMSCKTAEDDEKSTEHPPYPPFQGSFQAPCGLGTKEVEKHVECPGCSGVVQTRWHCKHHIEVMIISNKWWYY